MVHINFKNKTLFISKQYHFHFSLIKMTTNKILQGPKLTIPVPEKTLGQVFFESAIKYAEKVCQVDGTTDQTETYASVRQRSTRVAIWLRDRGITSADVIAFCTGNTIDSVIPILGAFYVGAKVANLEPSLSVRQTQHLISLSLPKMIFVASDSVSLIEASLQAANCQAEIVVYGEAAGYVSLQDLTRPTEGELDFRPSVVDVGEVALMFFSSGTTGLPKGICHSHRSFLHMSCSLTDMDLGNAVLHFTTFYWITAFLMLTQSHLVGGCRLFGRSFEAETVLKTIQKYKVTTLFMAPVLTYKLTNYPDYDKYGISSVKQVHCGGTPTSPTQFQRVINLFPHADILNVYGMTEIGYISSFDLRTDRHFVKTKTGSCGKPMPGIALKVVDPETNEVQSPNQKGEIRVQGESIMTGYYHLDSSSSFDAEGFLKSGDVGYYDEDGCLYVIERIKEMFKYQSWHIVPSAVEAVILEHPAVKEVAVFGVPCGADGEAPGACIVLEKDVGEEEIFDFVAKKASDREKLRGGIWFVGGLPRTPTGKILRREVRDLALNGKLV